MHKQIISAYLPTDHSRKDMQRLYADEKEFSLSLHNPTMH